MTAPMLLADLTQSWSDVGGGVGTYLRHKRQHILESTPHRHLLIVPGAEDRTVVEESGRAITVTIASPKVPGSPHYRLLLRNGAVKRALAAHRPAIVECQDSYNLPWAAIAYRKHFPETALVAAYMTDFPTVYVERPFGKVLGETLGNAARDICYRYCGALYRRFDAVFALSEYGGAAKLRSLGIGEVDVVPLGVELGEFSPAKRNPALRHRLGVEDHQPLLVYAGRLDGEKRALTVVEAFERLPESMGATLLLLGDGPLRSEFIERGAGRRLHAPGYVKSRPELAAWLASADIYVSGMADETFGISIIEAQASGLPVVGIRAGAMIDRIPAGLGRLGPVDDADAMAANIVKVWHEDHRAMGDAAQAHVAQFSWQESMTKLFGGIYARAVSQAALRARSPVDVPVALVER